MNRQPLQLVASGLSFLLIGSIVPVLFGLFGFALTLFLVLAVKWQALLGRGDAPIFAFMVAFFFAGLATSSVLGVMGTFLCLGSPPESRGGEAVIAALLLQVLGLLLSAYQSVAVVFPTLAEWGRWVSWGQLVSSLYPIFFFLFLYRLGAYLGRRDVCRRTILVVGLLVTFVLTGGVSILWFGVLQPEPPKARDAIILYYWGVCTLVLIGGISVFWGYFAWLGLLYRARRACLQATF